MILEEDDVGQGAHIAGGAGQGHSLLDVGGAGLRSDLKFKVGVDLLEGGLGGLQRGNVEVCVPGIDGQGVVVCGECGAGHGHKRKDHCRGEKEREEFLHDVASKYNFPCTNPPKNAVCAKLTILEAVIML